MVDLDRSSGGLCELVAKIEARRCYSVRVMDITTEIAIPSYHAMIEDKRQPGATAPGWATHPNPEVAGKMAILEAAQSSIVNIAGGREDLLINARSLGRHDGARPQHIDGWWHWVVPDRRTVTLSQREGHVVTDARDELAWIQARIRDGGIEHVAAVDLTRDVIRPVCAVRALIPFLETTNPFHTGPRARLALLADLLPRWYDGPRV
jgi:ribosomal protein S12 methylthiotransferase accessory factor